jgi:hypothetical protein
MPCRHHDIQKFDNIRCCLACGEAVFESTPNLTFSPQHEGSVFYKYAPLNYALGQEIRLAVVFPGLPSDDVSLDIVHVNLTDQPAYEAVSYSWATQSGDASLSQVVYCRGRAIAVTKQCEAALKCLRRQGRKRALWVDAISIDQVNISERNHQVGFMGTIYSNASQVLVYLGSGTRVTDYMLKHLNSNATALPQLGTQQLIAEFLRIRWLDRVWVLQEIALAKLATVIAGDKTVRWTHESIEALLGICNKFSIEPPSVFHWLPASEPHADILTVLRKSRNCSSSDPRDKVFAVLGLAHQRYQTALPVDYSLTFEEVFMRLAIHLIEEEKSLDVLKYVTGEADTAHPQNLPSWVPRWNIKVKYNLLPRQFSVGELDILQSTWFPSSPPFNQEKTTKLDKALLADILKRVPQNEPVMSTSAWRKWISLWSSETQVEQPVVWTAHLETMAIALTQLRASAFHFSIIDHNTQVDSHSPAAAEAPLEWPCLRARAHKLDIVCNTLSTHPIYPEGPYEGTLPQAYGPKRCCGSCKQHFVNKPLCQQDPSVDRIRSDEFTSKLESVGRGKTLFQTEQSLGLAQASVLSGDGIWALDGADVPFVLRGVGTHYVLLGECYLYRALKQHPCICCGCDVEPWAITTEIIDIW